MPLNSKLYKKFLYIWYLRSTSKDPRSLGRALEGPGNRDETYDVVIDLVLCKDMVSSEVASILRLAKKFNGTSRKVRLLTNDKNRTNFTGVELHRVPNLVIYKDQQSFINEITEKTEH